VVILGALAGVAWASDAYALAISFGAAAAALLLAYQLFVVRPARIPRGAVLKLRLAGALGEHAPPAPLERLLRRRGPTLHEVRCALEAARDDPRLSAVIVDVAGLDVGFATAEELHNLLRAAHRAGKRVIAVLASDAMGIREYFVAAGAGEIVANPGLLVLLPGLAAGGPFIARALKKAQVEAQTIQWKEYKGAAEFLSRESMSPALRESVEAVLADTENTLVDAVAAARGIASERARELLRSGFQSAAAAVEGGLVDRTGYAEEVEAEFDPKRTGKPFVSLARYLRHVSYTRERGRRPRIALIFGVGPVIASEPPAAGEFLSGPATAEVIDRAARDRRVRAIVFRINSPGGSAVGSDLVWRAITDARKRGKPVVASMGDVAGSGGYYVAMAADAIVAQPSTLTGSIGVVYAKLNFGTLLDRIGVHFDYAKTAESADALTLTRALTDAELRQLDASMGRLYSTFTAKVAESRKLDAERTEALARGRVWSGRAARQHGLIDELGGLSVAVDVARSRAGISAAQRHELYPYPVRPRLWGLRLALTPAAERWAELLAARAIGLPSQWAPAMHSLLHGGGVHLLLPPWSWRIR
jgi:protease-4